MGECEGLAGQRAGHGGLWEEAVKAGQAFVNLTMVGRDAVVVTRDGFGLAVGRLSRPDEQLGEVEWERLVSGMRALVCGSGLRP